MMFCSPKLTPLSPPDPIWSAGSRGPTWALVDNLLPLLDRYGVALYVSGRDPIQQHWKPSPTYPAVDFAGIGVGACAGRGGVATPLSIRTDDCTRVISSFLDTSRDFSSFQELTTLPAQARAPTRRKRRRPRTWG